jgi:MFS transporter, ACS family, hexuronate transporter
VKLIRQLKTYLGAHQRWVIVALLFFVAMVNNLDRQALSVLAPTLQKKFGFGAVEYSYVVASFLAAYAIGYLFCGAVLDRIGVKAGLALALGFWSLAGMLHAAAAGWISLAVLRFLLGLGESFNSPAGVKAIAEWIPPRERGLSMAVFSNGNIFGAVLAPPLVAFLTLHFGWRWGFLVTGAMGLGLLVLWWKNYESPERHPRVSPEERALVLQSQAVFASSGPAPVRLTMWQLLRHPACAGFFVARLLTDPVAYFFSFWLPDYLQHARGFSLAMLGFVGWLPFLAADVGGPGGGALSDWLIRRGWPPVKARRVLMLAAACVMPLAILAVHTEVSWLAVALIGVLLAGQSCWMANQLALISESVSRENVATMLALSALGGSLGGIVSTLLAGRLIASAGYITVFTTIAFLHLLAFGVLLLGMRRTGRT